MSAPVVLWAQDRLRLYLKIEKTDCTDVAVVLGEGDFEVDFEKDGKKFQIRKLFRKEINVERSHYNATARRITFEIWKKRPSVWKSPFAGTKPSWLKTDFDKWMDDLSSDEEVDEDEVEKQDLRGALSKVRKEEEEKEKEEMEDVELEIPDDIDLDGAD